MTYALPERMVGASGPHGFVRLENTTSRKAYWEGWIEATGAQHWFCYRFGRLGSAGKKGIIKFNGYVSAHAVLANKKNEKLDGDYVLVFSAPDAVSAKTPAPASAVGSEWSQATKPAVAQRVEPAPIPFRAPAPEDHVADMLDLLAAL